MRSLRYGWRISACDRSLALTSLAGSKSPTRGSPPCSSTRSGRTSKATSTRTHRLRPRSPFSDSCLPAVRMCTPFAGRALGPGRPAGAPPSWAAGRTRRNQAARMCHLTKEWWSRTSLVGATSVSIHCAAATNVDSWTAISMEKVGCSMRWPTSTPLPQSAFLLRSSDHARGKERTRGRSFLDRSRLQRLDAWECTSSARQWNYEPSSIWLATTACFRPRTSSRRDLSGT